MKLNSGVEVVDGSGYFIGWNVCRSYNFLRFSLGYLMKVLLFLNDDNDDDDMELDDDMEIILNVMVVCFF